MTEAEIKPMVERFLSWELPEDFSPDGGISFERINGFPATGTNLLTATQAEAMIRHMIEGE